MQQPVRFAAFRSPILLMCVTASTAVVAVNAFHWTLIDWITPFLMPPVQGAAWLFFATALAFALVETVRSRRAPTRALAPIAVCFIAIALLATVPFTRIWLAANFRLKLSDREAVVRQVVNHELRPNVSHNSALIALPPRPELSSGGNEIIIQPSDRGPFVFFFTYRGILDNASGFVWVPPGASPGEFRRSEFAEVIPYAPNWYFVSTAP
jgi:hypothetical protein